MKLAVISESNEIINYVKDNYRNTVKPVKSLLRDSSLALSGVDISETIKEFLRLSNGNNYSKIVLLTLNAPFSDKTYIDAAIYSMSFYLNVIL